MSEKTNDRTIKVLRVSHSASLAAYRARDRALVRNHPVQLQLIAPKKWKHLGDDHSEVDEPFRLITSATYGTGSIPLFAYDPNLFLQTLNDFKPDVLDIHEEPYSVSCFECFWLSGQSSVRPARVFYSAQNIRKSYPPPFRWTERYVYAKSDGAYPCSKGVRDVLTAKGFDTNCSIIPLGIDPELFKPGSADRTALSIEQNAVVIGYFGRLEECKGVQNILRALPLLQSQITYKLLVIGNGPYESQLKSLANQLGVSGQVHWIGEVTAPQVPRYLSVCDMTIVPSLTTPSWEEQFGRAVVESMACGVPVIGSDSGSLPEVVGADGLLFPELEVSSLRDRIEAMTDPKIRSDYRAKGIERVRRLYTWDRVAESMYQLYLDALSHARQQKVSI